MLIYISPMRQFNKTRKSKNTSYKRRLLSLALMSFVLCISLLKAQNLENSNSSADVYNLPIPKAEYQWPMASGPYGTWLTTSQDKIPIHWSVSNNTSVLWKTVLPEAGQSGIAVWGDKLFLTINKPLPEGTSRENAKGTDIIGYCLNTKNGEVEWTVSVPSSKIVAYSGLFSDNSSPTPITDGKHVWFINAGGRMACYDMDGNEIWSRAFESRTRHAAKQCEPMLVNGQLLYVMMRDSDDTLRKQMSIKNADRKSVPDPKLWPWTFIRAFDAATGKPLWTETSGTSVHNTPRLGYVDQKPVVFHARGGGHEPPETPYGFSLSSISGTNTGKQLWHYESNNIVAYTVSHFDEHFAYGFDSGELVKLDALTGELINQFPIFEKADIHLWNAKENKYEIHFDAPFSIVIDKFKKEPTNQTPILVGKYFLFMTHEGHCIGRVDIETGRTEYLQVPIQVVRKPNNPDEVLWDTHIPSDGKNSRGITTANDKRSQRDGWGHVTLGSPIAINEYVFFSTMIGMTYVVNSQQDIFDESALVSINDLGLAGETRSLSTPSFSNGKMYHRGLKYVVCIK